MTSTKEKRQFNRNLAILMQKSRRNAGLEQQELADKIGVASSTVSAWERGIITPNFYNIVKAALILEICLDDLAQECL